MLLFMYSICGVFGDRVAIYYYDDPTHPWAGHIPLVLKQQRRSNPMVPVYFITKHPTWTSPGVMVVRTSTLPGLPRYMVGNFIDPNINSRESSIRFWYMYQLMRRDGLRDVVQIEADQLVYMDLNTRMPFHSVPLWVTPISANKATASMFFASSAEAMAQFVSFMEHWFTRMTRAGRIAAVGGQDRYLKPRYAVSIEADSDMSLLWAFHRLHPGSMSMLPTIPPATGWPCIFDPGSYGQWLSGLTDLSHHSVQRELMSGRVRIRGACVNDAPLCNLHAVGKKDQIPRLPMSPTCTAAFGRKQGEVRPLAQ